MILTADNNGHDHHARMRRLIWAFAVRVCQKTRFRMAQTILGRYIFTGQGWLRMRAIRYAKYYTSEEWR